MSKKSNFDDEILVDQPDMGCYYHTDMFRFPEEELMRPQVPPMKGGPMKMPQMGTPPPSMMAPPPSMATPTPSMLPPSGVPLVTPPPAMNEEMLLSPTLTNIGYTQAFLRTLIGKRVRISFLIGTNMLVDRVGTLLEVGISYVVIRQLDANINTMADLYTIKFVDIYNV